LSVLQKRLGTPKYTDWKEDGGFKKMAKEIGLIWQMNEKITLEGNVVEAQARHRMAFGTEATVCNMNPDDMGTALSMMINGILVTAEKSCLAGEIFVGRKLE
jgi:hypothetical protein